MALQKTPVQINFGQGIDTKTDPAQVDMQKFLLLENAAFNQGALAKRKGFGLLTTLPNTTSTTLTTLNDNLVATGTDLLAYSEDTDDWLARGTIQPVDLTVSATVRTAVSQTVVDSVTSSTGLTCTAYLEGGVLYYQISDTSTGQLILSRTAVGSTAVTGRTFLLGNYFVVTYMRTVTATPTLLAIAIPLSQPTVPGSPITISTNVAAITTGYDGIVASDRLYLAWGGSAGTTKVAYLSSNLLVSTEASYAATTSDLVSVTADMMGSAPIIWITSYDAGASNGFIFARDATLAAAVVAKTQIITAETVTTLTSTAKNGTASVTYQVTGTIGSARYDLLKQKTCTSAAVVSSAAVLMRGAGLASKAFLDATGTGYFLAAYGYANESLQPSYFLLNYSGVVLMRLAYSNGAGYVNTQLLPSVSSNDDTFSISYLFKTLVSSVNKTTGAASSAGIYAQTGVNLASFSINSTGQYSSEVADSLHLTGGQVWQYDGIKPVELGFHVWPEYLSTTTATTGGFLIPQVYNYAFCYEWTDGTGKLHRSAPSVPKTQTVPAGTSTNTISITVPTLNLTAKTGDNKVRIVGYRWSAAQQSFYQFTSQSSPTLNDTTVSSVTIVDTAADSSIIGNNLLYTTGGILENIAAPATSGFTLYKNRLFALNSEQRNTVWYSKQVLQTTPVEFTDLQTIFVAPSTGSQGSSGVVIALSALDDKLIIFKNSSMYYVTGSGPDATGANNDFSDPVFITSAVGCTVPSSICVMPLGIMFQSNKGIWLLGRDLSTQYIGADVESYTTSGIVQSALSVPGTNEIRFTLSSGTVLMYDYYYKQWCTFTGVSSISSTLYQGAHTLLNSRGQIQKQNDAYLDITRPVLMKAQTAWIKLTGLQGYQRAYFLYILGTYSSPHRLSVDVAYDYDPATVQSAALRPLNSADTYGSDSLWGGSSPWGNGGNTEQYRVFFDRQRCQSVQITINETFTSADGVASAGLFLTSLNFVIGAKKAFPTVASNQSGS
jgi:hypothetical protein